MTKPKSVTTSVNSFVMGMTEFYDDVFDEDKIQIQWQGVTLNIAKKTTKTGLVMFNKVITNQLKSEILRYFFLMIDQYGVDTVGEVFNEMWEAQNEVQ